jgi:hypothetical protein
MNKFTTTTQRTEKVTVTINRFQLWKNFLNHWGDLQWGEFTGTDQLKKVARVLSNGESLSDSDTAMNIRRLFFEGFTAMLLGPQAMDSFDKENILREIVVQDEDAGPEGPVITSIIVLHEDITF